MGYAVLRPDQLEFTPPSGGDARRGIVRLSDSLRHARANIWRLPPQTRSRRHRETVQEEIFVVIGGTATLLVDDPPERVELPSGSIAIVQAGTALQLRNEADEDAVVLAVGAPPEPGRAEYLDDVD